MSTVVLPVSAFDLPSNTLTSSNTTSVGCPASPFAGDAGGSARCHRPSDVAGAVSAGAGADRPQASGVAKNRKTNSPTVKARRTRADALRVATRDPAGLRGRIHPDPLRPDLAPRQGDVP